MSICEKCGNKEPKQSPENKDKTIFSLLFSPLRELSFAVGISVTDSPFPGDEF